MRRWRLPAGMWLALSLLSVRAEGDQWADELQADYGRQYAELQRELDATAHPERVIVSKMTPDGGQAYREHLARLAKEAYRPEAVVRPGDCDPLDIVLRRTATLLADLRHGGSADLTSRANELAILCQRAEQTPLDQTDARRALFLDACHLRRRIALANPLLDFDKLLFLTHDRALFEHMCDQYYGFHAKPGGSIWVLSDPFTDHPVARDVMAEARVGNGRLAGRSLARGAFISLELSYDARTIYFAWTEAARTVDCWTPQSTYHVFRANVDGTGLVQLTDGPWNDFNPCLLPNGKIAFISERCGGYLRCGGPRANPTYVLYRMDADGSNVERLSYHETHEWQPSVDNAGMLVYTRWDYVDRDSDVAHHLWTSYPDGRDPRAYHGNYPARREDRPWMEMSIRAIPGSHRYVATAAAHHGQAYGSLVLIDTQVEDDHAMSQLRRLTPDVAFPEAERWGKECYGTPWPLSENYHLCVYDAGAKQYGIYLVDGFGNKELIWRDARVACLNPIPLRTRPTPPVLPEQPREPGAATGTVAIRNVYESEQPWPTGTRIAALRIVQLFPKETIDADRPRIGLGAQSLARGVLGTVPVEADGSACFEVPSNAPVYFQALDERGLAVQTMRSDTYVHAGERLTCQGCHESKWRAPTMAWRTPLALRREPSKIEPDVDGSYPLLYPRLVQPVLDRQCAGCHREKGAVDLTGAPGKGKFGWSRSFEALSPLAWAKRGTNGGIRFNGPEWSVPGQVGARASKLLKLLDGDHYGVHLAGEDLHRLTLWLDCNSVFYGAYHDTEAQLSGTPVLPHLR